MTKSSAWMLATIWVGVCAAAVLLSGAALVEAAVPAGPGAMAALLAPVQPSVWRFVTVLTVPLAALVSVAALPWVMAGASIVLLAGSARGRTTELPSSEPQRHIMWCRRRELRAEVMVMLLPGADRARIRALLEGARTTDSITVSANGRGCEVIGVMDGQEVDRHAIERRFTEALAEVKPQFGWATFPEDGFTLDLLLEQARTTTGRDPARLGRHTERQADRRPLEPALVQMSSELGR